MTLEQAMTMAAKAEKLGEDQILRRNWRNLTVEMGGQNMTSPLVVQGKMGLGDGRSGGQNTVAVRREAPASARKSACAFPGITIWPGTKACITEISAFAFFF